METSVCGTCEKLNINVRDEAGNYHCRATGEFKGLYHKPCIKYLKENQTWTNNMKCKRS